MYKLIEAANLEALHSGAITCGATSRTAEGEAVQVDAATAISHATVAEGGKGEC